MRCEKCGRPMKNAEMWQLGGNREAPTSRSMRQLCWDCRTEMEQHGEREPRLEMPATLSEDPAAAQPSA